MATKGTIRPRFKSAPGPPRPPKIRKGGTGGGSPGGPPGGPTPPPQVLELEFNLENVTDEAPKAQRGEDVFTSELGDHRKKVFVFGLRGRVYGEVPDPPRTRMHNHGGSFEGEVLKVVRDGDKIDIRVRMRGT